MLLLRNKDNPQLSKINCNTLYKNTPAPLSLGSVTSVLCNYTLANQLIPVSDKNHVEMLYTLLAFVYSCG